MTQSKCPVYDYANRVVSGKIITSKWVRLACQRHIDDLKDAGKRGLYFCRESANHAIEFFQMLSHRKGRYAGESFVLSDWQEFIVGSIFGWKRPNGYRRFTRVFVEVCRKNGKTTLAAGIALYLLVCDEELGAEVYTLATKKEQARICFNDAKALAKACPDIAEFLTFYQYQLLIEDIDSKLEPLSSDSGTLDGLNPSGFIADEIHAWKSRELYDVMDTGTDARDQALGMVITTAGGFGDESIYSELRNDAEAILEGHLPADNHFAFVACLDIGDDYRDPKNWPKGNPNLGVTITEEGLAAVVADIERKPGSAKIQLRNRFGLRTDEIDTWIPSLTWDKCANPKIKIPEGATCYGGLDMANTRDLAAFALAFPLGIVRGVRKFHLKVWLWTPEEPTSRAGEKLKGLLGQWSSNGDVSFTLGSVIDYQEIFDFINEQSSKYNLHSVAYDPFNANDIAVRLSRQGISMARFTQNAQTYNEPTVTFEEAIKTGSLSHDGNRVMRWMVGNTRLVVANAQGLQMPSKKLSRNKIDGVAASIMAIGRMIAKDEDTDDTYAHRGFDE